MIIFVPIFFRLSYLSHLWKFYFRAKYRALAFPAPTFSWYDRGTQFYFFLAKPIFFCPRAAIFPEYSAACSYAFFFPLNHQFSGGGLLGLQALISYPHTFPLLLYDFLCSVILLLTLSTDFVFFASPCARGPAPAGLLKVLGLPPPTSPMNFVSISHLYCFFPLRFVPPR